MKKIVAVLFCWLSFQIAQAQEITSEKETPFVLGAIHEMQSKELAEKRTLNIYLPEGYTDTDTIQYPVIYLLDGSADEDFIHVVGLVQFFSFPWVDVLSGAIVVGIANVDRKRDFTFPTTIEEDKKNFPTAGKSEKFIRFMENELQPYITKRFRTSASKTIIGQSLGGLLATEILFKKPYLFNQYIIISPSLWWNNESLLSTKPAVLDTSFKQRTSIYIAVGKEGKIMEADVKQFVSLLNKNRKEHVQVNFQYFPDEDHASIMHLAVYRAFQRFSQNK